MQHNREPARNRAGMLFAFLAMLTVVASVIGTLAATGRFSEHIATGSNPGILQDALRIDTVRTAHIYCPSSASYSPDGSRFAVLGTGVPCTDPSAALPRQGQHDLAIYSAGTGQLQSVVGLDHYFLLNTIPDCADVPVRALQFTGLGWSPDGEHFGVLYAAFEYPTFDIPNALSSDDVVCSGLLLLSVDTGTAVSISGDAGFFDAGTNTYAGYPIWNLLQLSNTPSAAVTPSLVYGWTQNGYPQSESALTGQPVRQLPTRAGPGYPVGNPSTDSTYSLWQPGLVAGPQVFGGGGADSTGGDDVFVTQFPTWIPPSGQIVTMIVAGVLLAAPQGQQDPAETTPTPSTPTAVPLVPLPQTLTQVPARDTALAAVQTEIGEDGWAMTTWNDEGSILATIDCSSPQSERLELRETGAGALVGSASLGLKGTDAGCQMYNFNQALGDYPNPNLSLQWSPDGTHILLSDQTANLVTLWRVDPFA